METENIPSSQLNTHQPHVIRYLNIKCSLCDLTFSPGEAKTNICPKCIVNSTDITVGITKEGIVNFCRFCRRYLRPPWTICERESKELMSICLRRLRGLSQIKIIDSVFVYTEPSSKRIKVRLTVQKEVMCNTNLQQTFVCEFYEHYQQCEDCKKEFTPHTWGATVQIRQRITHKKTFFYLEQLLLKNCVNDKVLKIENVDDGLDFFYKTRSHAARLVDFLDNILPIRVKQSKQLISHDMCSNIHHYKYAFGVELPKICKHDLVVMPLKLIKELGGICRIQICYKITTIIHLLDPITLKCTDLSMQQYDLYEPDFKFLSLKANSSTFTVLDCEKLVNTNLNESFISSSLNTFLQKVYNCQVMRDDGNYEPVWCKSFLGDILKPGMTAVGYDLAKLVLEEMEDLKGLPEIVIIKKQVDKEARKKRIFKLKRMEQQNKMEEEGVNKKKLKANLSKDDDDYEEFLDDVEKDKDMRKNMNLYRNEEQIAKLTEKELVLKEKHRVRTRGRKMIKVKRTETDEPKEQQDQKKDEDDWVSDADYEDDEVKLEELMKDLNLAADHQSNVQEDRTHIDDFINQMDKVKIV